MALLSIVKLVNQKGFSGLVLSLAIFIFLLAFSLGFYLGKDAQLTNKILIKAGDILNYDFVEDATGDYATSISLDTQLSSSLKSARDLPSIAAIAVEHALKVGNKGPSLTLTYNDGEYAMVDMQDTNTGIVEKMYLVKRNRRWIVYFYGNTLPSCAEADNITAKYSLKKDALTCSP